MLFIVLIMCAQPADSHDWRSPGKASHEQTNRTATTSVDLNKSSNLLPRTLCVFGKDEAQRSQRLYSKAHPKC